MLTIESSIYSSFSEIDFSINIISQTSLNDSVYAIIVNVVQTTEKEDNKVVEKAGDLRSDLNIKEQPKDLCSDFGAAKRNIRPISDPDLNDDPLEKLSIVSKPSNLGVKIPKNVPYIVIKSNIYIYLGDLQEARIF